MARNLETLLAEVVRRWQKDLPRRLKAKVPAFVERNRSELLQVIEEMTRMLLVVERVEPPLEDLAIRKSVSSLGEASRLYREAVDASGEGASTFPLGRVIANWRGREYTVSYNGRVWDGDRLVYDPRKEAR